jgi:hypothetical protein
MNYLIPGDTTQIKASQCKRHTRYRERHMLCSLMSIIFYITLAIITNSGAQVIYLDENILAVTKVGELCLLICTKKVELGLVWILCGLLKSGLWR